jgi:hypothetical protein
MSLIKQIEEITRKFGRHDIGTMWFPPESELRDAIKSLLIQQLEELRMEKKREPKHTDTDELFGQLAGYNQAVSELNKKIEAKIGELRG